MRVEALWILADDGVDDGFTACVLLFSAFLLFWGSVVFSRGSKKVLFWRTVHDRRWYRALTDIILAMAVLY